MLAQLWIWIAIAAGVLVAGVAALLWAVLPPIAVGFFEKVVFGSTHFLALVGDLVSGQSAYRPARWSAAIPPERRCQRTRSNPASPSSRPRTAGSGKAVTESGR